MNGSRFNQPMFSAQRLRLRFSFRGPKSCLVCCSEESGFVIHGRAVMGVVGSARAALINTQKTSREIVFESVL